MENVRSERASKVARESLKDSLKDQSRATCRSLIRKGADDYEAKRVCDAERKRKERKNRAKGSSSESLFSKLICSIYTPANFVCAGIYCFHVVRPSVRDTLLFFFLIS